MNTDHVIIFLGVLQLGIVAGSLFYLARQVHGEKVAAGFAAYSHVNDAYMAHLWRAYEHPELNQIWEAGDAEQTARLDAAQAARAWGAWYVMDQDERAGYRYTRMALEIFEQAWEVRRRDLIGADTWCKWEQWMSIWVGSRYFPYVFEDSRPRLLQEFSVMVEAVARDPAPGPTPRSSPPAPSPVRGPSSA